MKKTITLAVSLAFFCLNTLIAQTIPVIEWQRNYGGSNDDVFNSIQNTSDGGYILAGNTSSTDFNVTKNHGKIDFWVVKQNSNGGIEWQKSYGGSGNDNAYSIIQTSDGGYVVVGSTTSKDGDISKNDWPNVESFWIIKLDAKGNIQWNKCFDGNHTDIAYSVTEAHDSGYVVAGLAYSFNGDLADFTPQELRSADMVIIELNLDGDLIWKKEFGGKGYDEAISIAKTPDSGYIVAGNTRSANEDTNPNHNIMDAWVVKINGTGTLQWEKTYGGRLQDRATSIATTPDGGYIVTGNTRSFSPVVPNKSFNQDAWVLKLTADGTVKWQKSYGGSDSDSFAASVQTPDGGYVLAGYTNSSDGDITKKYGSNYSSDVWVVKLNKTGTMEWQKTLGGSDNDYSGTLQLSPDGNIIIAGSTGSIDGDITKFYGVEDEFSFLMTTDAWVAKLQPSATITLSSDKINSFKSSQNVFPNPFSDQITIQSENDISTVSIHNIFGQQLKHLNTPYQKKLTIATQDLTKGIYTLSVTTAKEVKKQQIIKR